MSRLCLHFLGLLGHLETMCSELLLSTREICEECLSVNKLDPAPSYPTLSNIKWLTECEHGFQTKNLKKLRSDFPLSTNRDEFSIRKIISN